MRLCVPYARPVLGTVSAVKTTCRDVLAPFPFFVKVVKRKSRVKIFLRAAAAATAATAATAAAAAAVAVAAAV